MKIDLPIADSWYAANERAREFLGVADDPDISVQAYLGVRHALWEISQALAQTFPHRRQIGYTPFSGPEGEFIALQFAKDGFTVKALSQDEFNQPKLWLETASKQMLCVLSAYDDPATGELYQSESHVAAMKDQRIFRVLIAHSYQKFFPVGKPSPYEIQIVSINPELAFAVMGERAKFVPPIAANLDWSKFTSSGSLNRASSADVSRFETAISDFKKQLPDGYKIHLSNLPTLPDRVFLLCEGVEGLSLITRIAAKLNIAAPEQGKDGAIETLSLCRWQEPRQLEWLSQKELTREKLRGSLIISSELIAKEGAGKIAQILKETRKELLTEQG